MDIEHLLVKEAKPKKVDISMTFWTTSLYILRVIGDMTALTFAKEYGQEDIVKLLLLIEISGSS